MENSEDKIRFKISVPYNNEELVKSRKKRLMISGIALLVLMPLFVLLAVLSFTSENKSTAGFGIFIAFAALCLVAGIVMFVLMGKAGKETNKSFQYVFHQDYVEIFNVTKQEAGNKVKLIYSFLYRPYGNKQYIAKITESETRVTLKIYTGTNNFVPVYKEYIIPRSFLNGEKGMSFINFLKQQVGQDYLIKVK